MVTMMMVLTTMMSSTSPRNCFVQNDPTDFDASENENVAANASHAAVIPELGARLRAMFP